MNMSTFGEHESLVLDISSPANKIRYCEGNDRLMWLQNEYKRIEAYPGGWFTIHLIALGQTDYPVPARIHWERYYHGMDSEYRLSPPSQIINNSCASISFQLHSEEFGCTKFKLYPQNPVCQNLIDGLILEVESLPCPLGFALSGNNSRCVCDEKLKILAQNCNIDNGSIERTKNSFWIFKQSNETLILHEYRCPIDYCTNDHLRVKLDDPFTQCDFNRTGMLCGQCQKNFSLALGSLHCIPCDNNHITLVILFAVAGVVLVAVIFLVRLTVSVGTLNGLFFYANIVQANYQAFFFPEQP